MTIIWVAMVGVSSKRCQRLKARKMGEIQSVDRTLPRQAAEIPARRSPKELVKTRPIGVSSSVTYQTPAVVLAAQVVYGVVLGTCVQIQHMMTDY